MSDYKSELLERFRSRDARVAIIGLGYVGLPLAVAFGEAGYHVVGIDMDARKVDALRSGESYIEDVAAESVRSLVQRAAGWRRRPTSRRSPAWTPCPSACRRR